MMNWQIGDRVYLTGEHVGSCEGRIEHVADPAQLPDIPGAPPAALVIPTLAELGVDAIMLVSWIRGTLTMQCCLLHTNQGWFDLQGQGVTIVGISNDPLLELS